MAFGKLLVIFAVAVLVYGNYQHEVEAEAKAKKALAAENEQKSRSANPGREKGSFQKLSNLTFNDRKHNRRQKNSGMKGILDIYTRDQKNNDMLNDNDRDYVTSHKTTPDNSTDSLNEKIKELHSIKNPYEAMNKYNYVPLGTGVYCNFETPTNTSLLDLCMWEWNTTLPKTSPGFKVMTPADVINLNVTNKSMLFSGPKADADGNVGGHFLYLAVDSVMESLAIKSPLFRGLREFCKFEAYLHQSRMQNASIKLVSESVVSGVQWILQEITGNNAEMWTKMLVTIGKTQQEVRIIIEVTRPNYINIRHPLPHIAVDNIRMVECLPEPPAYSGGPCQNGQIKCKILSRESCIKLQQVCDLVQDCDDGMDENKNCDKMPLGSYCNFESDSCGFANVPQPVLKWTRHYGPTPTDKTGPNFDHTCGPPDPNPTMVLPPLTPAHHSKARCQGYYFFVNMNVTGPNNETAGFASTAVMKTVVFNPPPKVHGNITSQYYNSCMIRFYYQQNGRNYGSLSVDLVELTSRGNVSTNIWFSTKNKGENWYRASIFLPNVTRRYYLEFKTRMGMRIYSDSAIDDFSMAPECFGLNIDPKELGNYNYYDPIFEEKTTPHRAFEGQTYYRFSTCGAVGRFGPTQEMCSAAYNNTNVHVTVQSGTSHGTSHGTSDGDSDENSHGLQVWEVPAEGLYTIIATGASGGLGSSWAGVSHAAQTRGLFTLHRGEKIYLMIGQQGTNACKKTLSAQESQVCSIARQNESLHYTSKTHEVRNTEVIDGGGGGGGATFVFVIDKSGAARPLLAAGGGGGLSVGVFRDDGSQHARLLANHTPENGHMYGPPGRTSGAGGGWVSGGMMAGALEAAGGRAARAGGRGGAACVGGAHGGYGGGGGGCLKGGGGGGWRGGSTSEQDSLHGGGGWSFTGGLSGFAAAHSAPRTGPGEVLIIPAIYSPQVCGCDYRCVALDEHRRDVRCYCPGAWTVTAHNHTTCILEDTWPRTSYLVIIGLSVTVFVFGLLTLGGCLYLYNGYQRKKEGDLRQKRLVEQELQLHRLRNAPGGDNSLAMAFNPHYGSEGFLPQGIDVRGLPQVSRESLKLVKALGQGAFGEVYQGLYRHRASDPVEMPVAVKTLPELSTGQAESDFLMEAAIMAKFNHPNIVHLIGVCFDRHPRFIVLELLAGGDLKNFLRESRPKPERVSALTMKDLLLCSLDICKGCKYLETQRFIHRDIAARNCLLTSRGPGRVVKIADFGMARDIYRADYYKKGGKAMLPIKWMPPEAYMDGVFTSKTDVWSFGVLVWEVFSLGVMPYTGCANREVMEMVSSGGRLEKPYGCPQEIYRMMCECWNPEPKDRPTFSCMFDKLQSFIQDPEIVSAPLPVVRSFVPPAEITPIPQSSPADYLVPLTSHSTPTDANSSTVALVTHSTTPTAAPVQEMEDSPYPPLLKASQGYGNIPMGCRGGSRESASGTSGAETRSNTKFLPSSSTDRLLSSIERNSLSTSEEEIIDERAVWETSFTEPRRNADAKKSFTEKKSAEVKNDSRQNSIEVRKNSIKAKRNENGPTVDKLISITPTSPKPPENVLSAAIDSNVIDKNNINALMPERKSAPIASPDPPRINSWSKDPPKLQPKPKPLCLDAAQLEQNLNALKKNSGSVNLTTMNILPPYINVVTPNKVNDTKTIQIDPKKAVIHDLQSPKTPDAEPEKKLKQSHSAASLLNGPMTDVPYADSDNASSSSSGKQNKINNKKNINYPDIIVNDKIKLTKQGSNGEFVGDTSEISC